MFKYFTPLLLAVSITLPASLFAKEIKIFTTLPVFSMIAQEIAADHAKISSLGNGQYDPHYLQITPSQSLALQEADIVISGQDLIDQLPCQHAQIVSVAVLPQAPSESFLKRRHTLAHWLEQSHHSEEHSHGPCCQHHQSEIIATAQHEWLSLTAMQMVAEILAQKLVALDVEHRSDYESRAQQLIIKLEVLRKQYQELPAPKPYLVYYEELALLEKEMGVSFGPVLYHCCHNKNLSPQRLARFLVDSSYRALLIPPSLDAASKAQLQQTIPLPLIELDTSGSMAAKGEDYADFMARLLHLLYHGEELPQTPAP